MREILFQGKRLDNGEWQCGCLLVYGQRCFIIPSEELIESEVESRFYWHLLEKHYEVDLDTVGQSTGRTDKNGRKVFEHDILQTFTISADGTVEKCGVCIVQWRENDQCYVLATKEGYHVDDFGNLGRPEYYEVIGNIHDNPELL